MAAPTVRGRTAPAAGGSASSPSSTAVGDMVIVFTWERAGAGVPTHTLDSGNGYVQIFSHSHDDGSTDGRLSVGYKIATSSGTNTYQAFTSSVGTEWWTGIVVLQTGTFAVGTITSTSLTSTNNSAPDPGSVTLGATRDWLVLAVGAWHHGSSATITPTAPTNYANLIEVSGSSNGDLGIADRSLTAPASENPGAFGDNIAPNGTVSATIGIGSVLAVERSVAISGTAAIATAAQFFSVFEKSVAISGTGSITVSGQHVPAVTEHERAAAFSGSSGIATSAQFFSVFERSAAWSSTGAIASVPQRELQRSAALAATGSLATVPQRELLRSAAISASASVQVAHKRDLLRSSALAASSTLTVGHQRDLLRSAALTATGAIAVSGVGTPAAQTHERSAALAAVGAVTATGHRDQHPTNGTVTSSQTGGGATTSGTGGVVSTTGTSGSFTQTGRIGG